MHNGKDLFPAESFWLIRLYEKNLILKTRNEFDTNYYEGPSIKYITLEGGGVREGVTVCDSGRG